MIGEPLDHLGLRFVLSGAMKVGEGAGERVALAGDSIFIDLSQPLRLEYADDSDTTLELTFWVPRTLITFTPGAPDAFHALVFRPDGPSKSVVSAAVRALYLELDRLSANELDHLICALFGLCVQLFIPSEGSAATPAKLESLATICRFIEKNLAARDLGVEKLARTFGLSRASLYRLFEPVGGVASYVRSRRLNRARTELQLPGFENRRIGPIAYQSGFKSVTAFNRAFMEAYGHTPREARRKRINCAAPVVHAWDTTSFGALGRSLLAITA
jgi:AraC-like DNA-binding protein